MTYTLLPVVLVGVLLGSEIASSADQETPEPRRVRARPRATAPT